MASPFRAIVILHRVLAMIVWGVGFGAECRWHVRCVGGASPS